ncbi:MAG: hypothetical protein GY859_18750 [Desulfobacterales bacterium]|nr:hypothetical protein [Desulfobacterales bacterium]
MPKGSPCIDAGAITDAPSSDISGISRPQGQTYDIGAHEYVGAPSVDIRANGSDDPVIVNGTERVEITVSLDPDNLSGQYADWWLLEMTPEGTFRHLLASGGAMADGPSLADCTPYSQSGIFRINDYPTLNLSCLSIGAHFFAFVIDLNQNGYLDYNALYYDIVRVDRVFVDADGDGFHSDSTCETTLDCNDQVASVYPGAPEICDDGIDQDCNGSDFDCRDVDNDGDGLTENQGDCDDTSTSVLPGAPEIRDDGVDQDCDGADLLGATIDDDRDGYTENQGDCNDAVASVHPGATEIRDDGVDQNCDGVDLFGVDIDDDGDGLAESQGDCNDADASVHPGAPEVRDDGVDQNCDGADLLGVDIDDDGDGYTENQGDCNDGAPAIHPDAPETCDDGIDQDCNGADFDCRDVDDDGDGYTENQGDCNDANDRIYPWAPEVANDDIDQDCNGVDYVHDNP